MTMGLAPGRRIRLYDAYIEKHRQGQAGLLSVEEAMSTSDFPTYIGSLMRHTFLARFQELTGSWTQYTKDFSLEDFEEYTSSRFGRFADVPEKPLNGPYEELAIKEYDAETLKLKEWGAGFSLTRQLIISDRLNQISQFPNMLAEALARTMSKYAAVTAFEDNPTMYDGNALFDNTNHGNLPGTTALAVTELGAGYLTAMEDAIDTQTDDEGYKIAMPGDPKFLIIPVELRWIVAALMNNELVMNASNLLVPNLARGRYTVIEERYFSDTNNYYMCVAPKGVYGFLAHVTLNGNTVPFLGLKDPGVRAVLGGEDPYSFEFDEVSYKIRHDFMFKPVEWRSVAANIVA